MLGRLALMLATALAPNIVLAAPAALDCTGPSRDYIGFRVTKVRVTSPLSFFSAAGFGLNRLVDTLPLKSGDLFDVNQYGEGAAEINNFIRVGFVDGFTSMRFVATVPRLENCTANTVEVHYVVYTAILPPLSGESFEEKSSELAKPATTGASLGTSGRFLIASDLGYNHTRRGTGGMRIQSQAPLGLFDHIEISSSASATILLSKLAMDGTRTLAAQYLNQADWHLAWAYRDVPVGSQRLKEGKLIASFFGTTKDLMQRGLLLHYGAALEGGHQQGAIQDSPTSPYGDLKLVAGIERRQESYAFGGSYGIQWGSTFSGHAADFTKHIFDLRYSASFLPLPKYRKPPDLDDRPQFIGKNHKPLSLEARMNAGFIQQYGQVPTSERFFGGNQQSAQFVEGQTWEVSGQPFIRSIPENQLGSLPSPFGIGGTRFYSLNLTFTKAIWGKALVPKELGSKDFVDGLDAGIKTAQGELSDTYFGADPTIKTATADVAKIKEQVDDLKRQLPGLSFSPAVNAKIAPLLKVLASGVNLVSRTADAILNHNQGRETSILLNTQVPALEANLIKLENLLSSSGESASATQVADLRGVLETARKELAANWTTTNTKAARDRANAHAENDLASAQKVLTSLLYQLNAYSLAPIAIFDMAKVSPSVTGTRYAVGGGMRLSIVNANFSLGYAANPHRAPGEGPGAVFFGLDISDLFH